jgi:uracil-DNA glycosylase
VAERRQTSHLCPIGLGGGGLIDRSWCFDNFAEVLRALPSIRTETDVLTAELVLATSGPWTVRYCPFDQVNRSARVVIIGITPGLRQMFLSCQRAQRALLEGANHADALRRAREIGAFAGSMRTNLVSMLDEIGVNRYLDIDTTSTLFSENADLLHSTSALIYPVFKEGRNYSGSPGPQTDPLLRAFTDQVLTAELAQVPNAVIVPLGTAVANVLRRETGGRNLDPAKCLFDFPHPSGANANRSRFFAQHRTAMARQVAGWGR